jgi:hypothetical protein
MRSLHVIGVGMPGHALWHRCRNRTGESDLIILKPCPFDSNCVTRENPVQRGRASGRSATIEHPEAILLLSESKSLITNFKRSCRGDSKEIHNGKSSFNCVKNYLLPVIEGHDWGTISERVRVGEISVRRVIKVNGRCAHTIDDPEATIGNHPLGRGISEEGE